MLGVYPHPPPHTYLRTKGLKKEIVKREQVFKEDYERRHQRDSMTHDEQKNREWVA